MKSLLKALYKALHRPSIACLVISFLVLLVVLIVRSRGWLQLPELKIYDLMVRLGTKPDSTDERIVIVGMTDDDLKTYGFPLSDADLAKVIEGVDAQQPASIGLDFYRDLPEPRTGESYPKLEAALKKTENLIAIRRVGYVDPPPALKDDPGRVSANNLPKDFAIDGYYRRGPLVVLPGDGSSITSFSFAVTIPYLEKHGIECGYVDDPRHPGEQLIRLGSTVFPRVTSNAGGYVGLRSFDYDYLVDFEAPRRFRVQTDKSDQTAKDTPYDYSFGELLEGRIPDGALKDKIVFLATVMESVKDSNPTPIDDNLRGVQQHVMMVHQLLEAGIHGVKPKAWWPDWAEELWIAAATLLGGVLGAIFRSPWKLAPALALIVTGIVLGGQQMFAHGIWILVAAPAIGCFGAATFVTSFIAYLERTERGAMETIFSKHVSSDIVDALWAGRDEFLEGGRLKPRRMIATVLFTDLKGFSTTSEKMDPSTLMDWMNEYMDGIARHVDLNGGIINKFIGDAIMAIFGVPVARTTEAEMDRDAVNAVNAALAMRAELAKLNAGWAARGLPTTAMRVGIYTGPLVAGSMGSAQRLEFTVLGDTVNTAARLESAGKEAAADPDTAECTILIGESTFQRLHGRYVTQRIGSMSLKGKAEKIIVHSVISAVAETGSSPESPASVVSADAPRAV